MTAYKKAIHSAGEDHYRDLTQNTVICGAGGSLTGVDIRLREEFLKNGGKPQDCRIINPPERTHSIWIGGSILASLSTYVHIPVTKDLYEEHGSRIWFRKTLIA
jgi:actin-related protein